MRGDQRQAQGREEDRQVTGKHSESEGQQEKEIHNEHSFRYAVDNAISFGRKPIAQAQALRPTPKPRFPGAQKLRPRASSGAGRG